MQWWQWGLTAFVGKYLNKQEKILVNSLSQKLVITISMLFFTPSLLFSSTPLETVRIQLKWFHQFQFAGYYAAIEKGFYAQEGLNVILQERNTTKSHIKSVLDGESEYGVADAGLLLDRMSGQPVIQLLQIFQHSPLIFVSLKTSNIMSPFDMTGKKVMMDNDGHGTALIALLIETLGNTDTLKIVSHKYNVEDLISGKIDVMSAYISDLPYAMQQRNIPVNVINPQNYGIDFYGDNFFTTEKEIRTNPERVKKMIRATLKGWQYALDHKDELIQIIHTKYNPNLSIDQLYYEAKMIDLMILSEITPLGSMNVNRYKKVAEMYKKTGVSIVGDSLQKFIYGNNDINFLATDLMLTPLEKKWIQEHPDIVIAFDGDYAPYSFKNDNGSFEGIAVDFANEIAKKTGLTFKVHPDGVWKKIYKDAFNGKIDVVATMMIQPDRKKSFNFTNPYISLSYYVITQKRNNDINHHNKIRNKKVALVKNYSTTQSILKKYPSINHYPVNGTTEAILAVSSGKADATVLALGMAQHLIAQHSISNLKFAAPYADGSYEQSFAVRKDMPMLTSILDKALMSISNDDRIRIFQRWSKLEIAKEETVFKKSENTYLTKKEIEWVEKHPVIRVASCDSLAPIEFVDEGNEYTGISIDYLNQISKKMDINFQIKKNISWTEGLEMIQKRELDMLTAVTVTKEKKQYLLFTKPYLTLPTAIFTLDTIAYIHEPDNLNYKKVAVIDDYPIEKYLQDHFPKIDMIKVKNVSEALKLLQYKSVFAYVGSIFITSHYITNNEGYNNVKMSGHLDYKYDISMAARNDWPLFVGILQKGLNSIGKTEQKNIYRSWVPVIYKERINYSHIIKILIISGAIMLLFLIWNRVLKREINERKQAEQEAKDAQFSAINVMEDLKAAKEKAEEAANAKSIFLANISHEIRTPMNSILGFIDIVLDRQDLQKEMRKYLEISRTSAASLLSLINEILDVSKAESGKLSIANKAFHIQDVLQNLMDIMEDKAYDKGLSINTHIDSQVPEYVIGDPYRLRQVLINLVDNAIKFTVKGEVSVTVELSEQSDFILFSVKDTGIGIRNDLLNILFNPFVQLDNSTARNYGGTGLGTTISKHLIELMGGNINVTSKLGQGSCFSFTVNLPETTSSSELENISDTKKQTKRTFTILLVEDIIENAKLAITRLENQGHIVDHAWNGREAIERLNHKHYDIVLMDIQMPLMNGIEATKLIRQMGKNDLPVIALTARIYQKEKQTYFDAGMNDIVSKPIDFNLLFEVIEKHVLEKKNNFIAESEAKAFPDIKGVDVVEAMERIGDMDFLLKELVHFSKEYQHSFDDIRLSIANNDLKTAYELAHRIKGLSGNLSIKTIYQQVSILCNHLHDKNVESARKLLPSLKQSLSELTTSLNDIELKPDQTNAKILLNQKSDIDDCKKRLTDIQQALDKYDIDNVEQIFETLELYFENHKISQLSKHINEYDYEGALAEVQRLMDYVNTIETRIDL